MTGSSSEASTVLFIKPSEPSEPSERGSDQDLFVRWVVSGCFKENNLIRIDEDPLVLVRTSTSSPSPGGRGLACSSVGGQDFEGPHQVVTEGAQLRQRQVDPHLDIEAVLESRDLVQIRVLIRTVAFELSRLLQLKHTESC